MTHNFFVLCNCNFPKVIYDGNLAAIIQFCSVSMTSLSDVCSKSCSGCCDLPCWSQLWKEKSPISRRIHKIAHWDRITEKVFKNHVSENISLLFAKGIWLKLYKYWWWLLTAHFFFKLARCAQCDCSMVHARKKQKWDYGLERNQR